MVRVCARMRSWVRPKCQFQGSLLPANDTVNWRTNALRPLLLLPFIKNKLWGSVGGEFCRGISVTFSQKITAICKATQYLSSYYEFILLLAI